MAREFHLGLRERQLLAGRDLELPGHEILPGDRLRHRMLDLQAGVHLQEVEGAVGGQQELDRAGAAIADGARGGDGGRAHAAAQVGVDGGRGRLLDHLLVAALHRAVALAEMDDVAVGIGEHLDLDMARVDDGLLQDQLARAEGALGLVARAVDGVDEVGVAFDQPHAAAAAAGRGLDHHRQADLARLLLQGGVALVGALIARHAGHAGIDHAALGGGLVAHGGDGGRRRADEDQAGLLAGVGEGLVLRQEAVAGMDGVGARFVGRFEEAVDAEIALAHQRRPDPDGLVREGDVRRLPVGVGIDRHGAIAHRPGRAHDPPGDLAAIGDHDLAEAHFRGRPSVV